MAPFAVYAPTFNDLRERPMVSKHLSYSMTLVHIPLRFHSAQQYCPTRDIREPPSISLLPPTTCKSRWTLPIRFHSDTRTAASKVKLECSSATGGILVVCMWTGRVPRIEIACYGHSQEPHGVSRRRSLASSHHGKSDFTKIQWLSSIGCGGRAMSECCRLGSKNI